MSGLPAIGRVSHLSGVPAQLDAMKKGKTSSTGVRRWANRKRHSALLCPSKSPHLAAEPGAPAEGNACVRSWLERMLAALLPGTCTRSVGHQCSVAERPAQHESTRPSDSRWRSRSIVAAGFLRLPGGVERDELPASCNREGDRVRSGLSCMALIAVLPQAARVQTAWRACQKRRPPAASHFQVSKSKTRSMPQRGCHRGM